MNGTLFVLPPVQVYETPPVPFKVTAVPLQTVVAGDAVEETVGNGFTVMVVLAVFVHPAPFVPVTIYVAVDEATKGTLFEIPPDQVYVDAPVPFSVTIVPVHTVVPGEAVEDTVGNGFTVMVMVFVFTQPFPSVPVTVYVVVVEAVNGTLFVTPPVHE